MGIVCGQLSKVGIVQGAIVREAIVQGDNCPR